jgi:hypothetical protein
VLENSERKDQNSTDKKRVEATNAHAEDCSAFSLLKLDMNIMSAERSFCALGTFCTLQLSAQCGKISGKEAHTASRKNENRTKGRFVLRCCRKKKPLKLKIVFWRPNVVEVDHSLKPPTGSLTASNLLFIHQSVRSMPDGQAGSMMSADRSI